MINFIRRYSYHVEHKTKLSILGIGLIALDPILCLGSRRPRGRSAFRTADQLSDDLRSVHALALLRMAKRNRNILSVRTDFRFQTNTIMGGGICSLLYARCSDSLIFPDEVALHPIA